MVVDSKKILVVDDESDIVDFLMTVLQDEGYDVICASDGVEALSKIREAIPTLVLLDLMMPRMTGFDVLDALREEPVNQRPSIIVLSAKSTHEDVLNALEKGANDFIPKPFDLEDLLLRIRVWMERTHPLEAHDETLRIYTLSPFRVLLGDTLLFDEDMGDRAARLLIKYLVTEPGAAIPREKILYLLWPDLQEHVAEERLRAVLEGLRSRWPGAGNVIREEGNSLLLDMG